MEGWGVSGSGHGLVRREATSLVWAAVAVGLASVAASGAYLWYETRLFRRRDSDKIKSSSSSSSSSSSFSSSVATDHVTTLFDSVGNTPLLRVPFFQSFFLHKNMFLFLNKYHQPYVKFYFILLFFNCVI
jgi:hypothetical protein